MKLIDHLQWLAGRWCEETGRSPARLSTHLVNDGKFLAGLANGKTTTVETYEKCVAWFGIAANWTSAGLPADVADRLAALRTAESAAA